jgi:hypothetical protein
VVLSLQPVLVPPEGTSVGASRPTPDYSDKVCSKCGGPGPFCLDKKTKDGLGSHCKKCKAANALAWRVTHLEEARSGRAERQAEVQEAALTFFYKLKARVYAKYGNRCNNPECSTPGGCTDVRCLQIDHVNDDGSKDRYAFSNGKMKGHRGGRTIFYKRVLQDTEGRFQLLCANCNTVKSWETNQLRLAAERRRNLKG